ncbi:polar amino acid transport system substrate-binding protein [Pseudoalteromonas prydzensis ACAM 620]|nr:polar amino acid transport system substrate-binding protein [Pseudoalteromonas prydzensis ACAM 620]
MLPWPPFVFDGDQALTGIDIDISRLVLTEAGFCSYFVRFPTSKRGLVELEKGRVDVLSAASFTQQRAQYSHFSTPYRRERMRLFWYEDPRYLTHSLAELLAKDKTIAVNNGGYYGKEFEQLSQTSDNKESIVRVPLLSHRLHMLKAKRVDFMIDDEISGQYLIRQEEITGITLHPYVIHDNPIHFMLSKKTVTIENMHAINSAIINVQAEIEKIIASYTLKL